MGVLDELLEGTRAGGGVFVQMVLDPPWSLRMEHHSSLSLVTVATGSAVLTADHEDPVVLQPGDVAIVAGGHEHVVADAAGTAPQLLIGEGGESRWLPGAPDDAAQRFGVRTFERRADDASILLVGSYDLTGDIGRRLVEPLPAVATVRADELPVHVTELVAAEIAQDAPGQQLVLERWLDIALVTSLRAWFDRPESQAPGWYLGHDDPAVGAALSLMHDDPAHPWTLVELSERTGVSRAGLARRFTQLVGEPPMGYLTAWRISLAADLLRTTDQTLDTVAHQVGYSTAFALSTAFKRLRGSSPSEFRRQAQLESEPAPRESSTPGS